MTILKTTTELLSEFSLLSEEHGNLSFSGNYKAANEMFEQREEVFREIESRGEAALESFKGLLEDERPFVRVATAGRLLNRWPELSESVLANIALHSDTPAGFTAKYILKEWKLNRHFRETQA
jgi:hypothetical protein